MNHREHMMSRRTNSGFALIEAMISFLILAVGLVALLSFTVQAQRDISESKAEAEAASLAEEKLHELESFLSGTDPRLDTGTGTDSATGELATFSRSWTITGDAGDTTRKTALVTVSWNDRTNTQQSLTLSSEIFFRDPSESPQDFLIALNEVREFSASGANVWGDGTGTGVTTGQDTGTETGTDTSTDTGTDTGTDNDTVNTVIIIAGSVDVSGLIGQDPVVFNGVTPSNFNYTMSCEYTSTTYTCQGLIPQGQSLNVKLTFSTNGTFCTPTTGYYNFTGVTSSILNGYNLVIRKNWGSCP